MTGRIIRYVVHSDNRNSPSVDESGHPTTESCARRDLGAKLMPVSSIAVSLSAHGWGTETEARDTPGLAPGGDCQWRVAVVESTADGMSYFVFHVLRPESVSNREPGQRLTTPTKEEENR